MPHLKLVSRLLAVASLLVLIVLPGFALAADQPAEQSLGMHLYVFFDRGLEGKNQNQCNQLNQLSNYLEPDLLRQLKAAGYTVSQLADRGEFKAGTRTFLLVVKTANYNPGSAAVRITVGLGAGAAHLDLHYELFDGGEKPFWSFDHGRGSSRDWRKICVVLNRDSIRPLRMALSSRW